MIDPPTTLQPLLLTGHVLDVLRALPEKSVQVVVTSPPYWGLRAYGTEPQVWGGEPNHVHEWGSVVPGNPRGGSGTPNGRNDPKMGYGRAESKGSFCSCGAWRGELGLEPTPQLYVQHLVDVFREIRHVLRDDGVCWLNLGDSYAGTPLGKFSGGSPLLAGRDLSAYAGGSTINKTVSGLKPKDLVGIPWRTAFALQADGWWLRSGIPWVKPNGMPESVTDRPTLAHEYIFLLAKSSRYFYDQDGFRQPYVRLWDETNGGSLGPNSAWMDDAEGHGRGASPYPMPRGSYSESTLQEVEEGYSGEATKDYYGTGAQNPSDVKRRIIEGIRKKTAGTPNAGGRRQAPEPGEPNAFHPMGANLRSWWYFPSQAYPDAHFATYPRELPKRCILLGTSEHGACAVCGAPWKRHIEVIRPEGTYENRWTVPQAEIGTTRNSRNPADAIKDAQGKRRATLGWQPTCECRGKFVRVPNPDYTPENGEDETEEVYQSDLPLDEHPITPCLVLDPFSGSGTTVSVGRELGRRSIGIDLNPKYTELAENRREVSTPSMVDEW